jgi:hypothetical protein
MSTLTHRISPPSYPQFPPPRHLRASHACQNCRSRKVRCDVVLAMTETTQHRCTNCRLDGVKCVVPESNRIARRKRPAQATVAAAASPKATFETTTTVKQSYSHPWSVVPDLVSDKGSPPEVKEEQSEDDENDNDSREIQPKRRHLEPSPKSQHSLAFSPEEMDINRHPLAYMQCMYLPLIHPFTLTKPNPSQT